MGRGGFGHVNPPKENASLAARPLARRGVGKIKILFVGYVAQVRERSVGHVSKLINKDEQQCSCALVLLQQVCLHYLWCCTSCLRNAGIHGFLGCQDNERSSFRERFFTVIEESKAKCFSHID